MDVVWQFIRGSNGGKANPGYRVVAGLLKIIGMPVDGDLTPLTRGDGQTSLAGLSLKWALLALPV